MRMRANGHGKHLLVRDATNADWAPNAKRIAFERNGAIFVARANGHRAHVLRRDSGDDLIYDDPAWSPNGRRIAYSLFDESDIDTSASVHTIRPDRKGDRYVVSGYGPDW
jgi:Tol biopolymer transport system component